MQQLQIRDNFKTLEELTTSRKSIIRFGDGEYTLIAGLLGGGGVFPFSSMRKI